MLPLNCALAKKIGIHRSFGNHACYSKICNLSGDKFDPSARLKFGETEMQKRQSGVCALAMAVAMLFPALARADETPPPAPEPAQNAADPKIVDIVVTAQRRSESTQKTALAIQVLQPTQIANAGVTSGLQLTSLVPSLLIGNSGPAATIYVRGVGSFASTAGQSPAIPFYIDGVYVARSQSVSSEFYDIDRLEVLKGPQGTLYGRNASGGAINVITANPKLGVTSGHLDFEFGNYANINGEAALNIPIGDTVAIRASGQIVDKGGYTSVGAGDDVHQSARIKALWMPTSDMSLLINASWGHIGGLGPAQVAFNRDIPGWYPWMDGTDPRAIQYTITHPGGSFSPPFVVAPDASTLGQNLKFWNVSATFDWKLGGVKLTVIPSYRDSKMTYVSDFAILYGNGLAIGDPKYGGSAASGTAAIPARPESSRAFSVEARLSGEGERFKWVAGLYYFSEPQYQQYIIAAGYDENLGDTTYFGTRSAAAFGQASYNLTSSIRAIGGLRYTSDYRTTSGNEYVVSPTAFNPGSPIPPAALPCTTFGSTAGNGIPDVFFAPTSQAICEVDSQSGAKVYHNISWKGGLEADVFEHSLAYATASKGFKAGGFNTQSITGQPGAALDFKPETLTSFDIGLKNRFLDNRLQLNFSGFYWDYKNHQEPKIAFTNEGIINLIYFNAGETRIFGGNMDFVVKPWQGATLNGTVEYANSKYLSFSYQIPSFTAGAVGCPVTYQGATATVNCAGFQALKSPEWTGGVGFAQAADVTGGTVTARANFNFASSRFLGTNFSAIERAAAYGQLDTSISYRVQSGRFTLTGFVRNVTNAAVYTSVQNNPFSSIEVGTINAPRTYGARASVSF